MPQTATRDRQRIHFDNEIHLLPQGEGDMIVARAGNLSESGIFVTTAQPCPVGTELYCDLPLEPERIRVKGRVAWARPDTSASDMGIEFFDLTDSHFNQLRRAIVDGDQPTGKLQVWFCGMDQPVAAEARPTADGFILQTALPFLRIGSDVAFSQGGVDLPPQHGKLAAASLVQYPGDPIPQLAVQLIAGAPAPMAQHSSEQVPLGSAERASQELVAEAPHTSRPIDPTTAQDIGDTASATAIVPPDDENHVLSGVIESPIPLTIESMRAARDMQTQDHREPAAEAEPLSHQLLTHTDDPYEAPTDPSQSSGWILGEDALDQSASAQQTLNAGLAEDWKLSHDEAGEAGEADLQETFWQDSTAARGQKVLWFAAVAMLAVTGASGWYTGFFSRTAEKAAGLYVEVMGSGAEDATDPKAKPTAQEQPAQASVSDRAGRGQSTQEQLGKPQISPPSSPAPKTPPSVGRGPKAPGMAADGPGRSGTPVVGASSTSAPGAVQGPKTAGPSDPVAKARRAPDAPSPKGIRSRVTKPTLTFTGHKTELRVGIRGSIAKPLSYPLADPAGLVLKLPRGRALLKKGTYTFPKGPVRTLWIRSHKQGVQIRYLYRKGAHCTLRLEADAATLSCPNNPSKPG